MSENGQRDWDCDMPRPDGDRYYPAPLLAGPWVVPIFWLVVLALAGLF